MIFSVCTYEYISKEKLHGTTNIAPIYIYLNSSILKNCDAYSENLNLLANTPYNMLVFLLEG